MFHQYNKWLTNAPICKKFIPTQIIAFTLILVVGIISLYSVFRVNNLSHQVFTENVKNTEMLTEITETMYMCRVMGRDILLQENPEIRNDLYVTYLSTFQTLDEQMDEFSKRLSGEKLQTFKMIIVSKNIYKDSMILSAHLKLEGDNFDNALQALTRVTPIANDFFGSIDTFLTEEKILMEAALNSNDAAVIHVLLIEIAINIAAALALFYVIKSLAKTMSTSLVMLECAVSEIANTNNMKINIPDTLFTEDEIGSIATATNKLKTMLQDYSFRDILTGGYNANAYREELSDIFAHSSSTGYPAEFWCIIFDMNNLKQINDNFGHIEGDTAIKDMHNTMVDCFSQYGKTFRVGGDEFVSILVGCTEADIAENLKKMALSIQQQSQNKVYALSVAWGYGLFKGTTGEEYEEHFKSVDKKMYQNKENIKYNKKRHDVVTSIRL